MIFKLCYQNEIHRISEPPTQLSDFYNLILTTFRTQLPEEFFVSYSIKGEVENVLIKNQEDYEALLSMGPSKTAKVIIKDSNEVKEPASADYDIISNKTKEANAHEERKAEDKRDLADLIQNVSESVIIPQAQKYPYIDSAAEDKDENTRKIVKEILHDQMPYIIAQVKEAVLKELRGPMPVYQQNVERPKAQVNLHQQHKEDDKVEINARDSEVLFERADYYEDEPERIPERPQEVAEKNDLLNKMKMFGNALKDKLVVLPGKAKDAFDDVAQKLEGDPYVVVEEGKFPKSVVDKANLLKEVFPEEDRKVLLHFVKQYPRHATLEQLANLYLVKDEPQEQAQAQNNA